MIIECSLGEPRQVLVFCVAGGGRLGWAVAFVTTGAVLEVLQRLGGVRTASWADGAANAAGVACGWLLLRTRLAVGLFWVEGCLLRVE